MSLHLQHSASLIRLDYDILHLILMDLTEISLSSVASFARASKATNFIATPFLYRSLVFVGGAPGDRKRQATDILLQRFRAGDGDSIAKYVRNLRFEQPMITASEIEEILRKTENIQSLSFLGRMDRLTHVLDKVVNWSKIRKLDFRGLLPDNLFKSLTGKTPRLRSLEFEIFELDTRSSDNREISPLEYMNSAVEYIRSMSLQSLTVRCIASRIQELWPAIKSQKDTLRALILRSNLPQDDYDPTWLPVSYIEDIAKEFILLKHVGLDVPFTNVLHNIDDRGHPVDSDATEPHPRYLTLLESMDLETIDLHFHLPDVCSAFISIDLFGCVIRQEPPIFEATVAKGFAMDLAKRMLKSSSKGLKNLNILFICFEYDESGFYFIVTEVFLKIFSRHDKRDKEFEISGSPYWKLLKSR